MQWAAGSLGRAETPPKGKLLCGLIYHGCLELEPVLGRLEQSWGAIEFISQRIPFTLTRYYEKEMGRPLYRKFLTFREPVEQGSLVRLKVEAAAIEAEFLSPERGRRVNIDPGVLTSERLVLATTKRAAHRPYVSDGIYADLTLVYERGGYRPLPWTYPDYAGEAFLAMANGLRERHRLESRWKGPCT